jgi:hypothetical protein
VGSTADMNGFKANLPPEVAARVESISVATSAPSAGRNVRNGHVSWLAGSAESHIKRIRNLAKHAIRGGAGPGDITIVADTPWRAAFVRMALLELGVPIRCSESHLLPMHYAVRDLLCMLAAVHGPGRLQALCHLLKFNPFLDGSWLGALNDLFAGDLADVRDFGHESRTRTVLEAFLPLREVPDDEPLKAVDTAHRAFEQIADDRALQDIFALLPALRKWAGQFDSVSKMLAAFWRWRVLLSGWSSYQAGAGVQVTTLMPINSPGIIVLLLPENQMPNDQALLGVGEDIYRAPLADCTYSPETASVHEPAAQSTP